MTRKTTIPMYDGDDFEELAARRMAVAIAERNAEQARRAQSAARAGDDDPSVPDELQAARDAYDTFVDEAAERAEMWVLTPIGHAEYRQLLKDHPPRTTTDGDGKESILPEDEMDDVNVDTFPQALLTFVDPEDPEVRTVAEPFENLTALRRRLKRLSAGEFETIWRGAKMINEGGIADPKLLRFSPAAPRSSET